jgi:nucleotide-binding universal stress UspA family protein
MYTRIVVPLDGSEIAEAALVQAEHMATLTGAPVHLVRVVDLTENDAVSMYGMMADPSAVSTLLADEVETAQQYLDMVQQRIVKSGHRATNELRRGPVASALIDATKPGDLLVMASHGRSGIARWFMGSVAEDLIRRSTVPVLLVKATTYKGKQEPRPRTGATMPSTAIEPQLVGHVSS